MKFSSYERQMKRLDPHHGSSLVDAPVLTCHGFLHVGELSGDKKKRHQRLAGNGAARILPGAICALATEHQGWSDPASFNLPIYKLFIYKSPLQSSFKPIHQKFTQL
ncbi:MAG: hypothetical protein WAM78_21925 [Candidatus Sulfotelmatobacter sp.]